MVDVSLCVMILKNIYDLKDWYGIFILYIIYDFVMVYYVFDYVIVFYKGYIVEVGFLQDVIGDLWYVYIQFLIFFIFWFDLDCDWGLFKDVWQGLEVLDWFDGYEMIMCGNILGFELVQG